MAEEYVAWEVSLMELHSEGVEIVCEKKWSRIERSYMSLFLRAPRN